MGSWGHIKGYASLGPEECSANGGCNSAGPRVPRPNYIENYYGDDNSRALLGALSAANMLNTSDFDAQLVQTAFALLRTTGPDGFRTMQIHFTEIESRGWQSFFDTNQDAGNLNPHYIAELWAMFFALYQSTGIELFKTQALKGLAKYMSAWPTIVATESITEEQIRLLLPLAWRIRVEDTPANRADLRKCWEALRATWVSWAGVPTCTMSPYGEMAPPCTNNQEYGNGERSVCQQNGDPASDLLYESNFLLLNLQEAYAATREQDYADHAQQLAEYIARVQAHSDIYPHYTGTFFRAFDYSRWEMFGSSGDWGWPAWGIETGWTTTWIVAGLGMPEVLDAVDKSFWSLVTSRSLAHASKEWCGPMFEANATTVCVQQDNVVVV